MLDLSRMLYTIKKLVSKLSFVCQKIFNKTLVAVYKIKEALTLNKPIYAQRCN